MSALAAAFGLMLFLWLLGRGKVQTCRQCGQRVYRVETSQTHWVHARTHHCWEPPYSSDEWGDRYLAGEENLPQPHPAFPNDADL